jgi:hypothetical protein
VPEGLTFLSFELSWLELWGDWGVVVDFGVGEELAEELYVGVAVEL